MIGVIVVAFCEEWDPCNKSSLFQQLCECDHF